MAMVRRLAASQSERVERQWTWLCSQACSSRWPHSDGEVWRQECGIDQAGVSHAISISMTVGGSPEFGGAFQTAWQHPSAPQPAAPASCTRPASREPWPTGPAPLEPSASAQPAASPASPLSAAASPGRLAAAPCSHLHAHIKMIQPEHS